ncbi:hypothetical protein [Microbacterium sp.]|uniref:hypothetical protein n=1 Tax=Microbacterium sp. TaxID=51671 RepID=UPI0037C58200
MSSVILQHHSFPHQPCEGFPGQVVAKHASLGVSSWSTAWVESPGGMLHYFS